MGKTGIEVEGTVVECLSQCDIPRRTGQRAPGAGAHQREIRRNYIKIMPFDRVLLELSPYDLGRGRILFRYRTS
jgi:translation initiation factor IF-1